MASLANAALFRRCSFRGVACVTIALTLCAALSYAYLPLSEPATNDEFNRVGAEPNIPDFSNFTSLKLLGQLSSPAGIPSVGINEYSLRDGNVARLSLDQSLQLELRKFLEKSKVPYAVFVAVEPKTGRILANISYSSESPSWELTGSVSVYPMASLFKIVTAAAAFESGMATAETSLSFRGGYCSESPRAWGNTRRRRDVQMPLSDAMAHSVNPAFGRLANDRLGKRLLLTTAQQFGLGTNLFGTDFIASGEISSPSTDGELMRMAAGLDHGVRISPFHVAMLFAALGNGGVMPTPSYVDAVDSPAGTNLYNFQAVPLITLTSPAVADELIRSMSGTVISGTARKAFSGPGGLRFRTDMLVAGKTGSINGDNPRGHYNWFAGVAPAENPTIAFAALVVNNDRCRLRAPQLGRFALDVFFQNKMNSFAQLAK